LERHVIALSDHFKAGQRNRPFGTENVEAFSVKNGPVAGVGIVFVWMEACAWISDFSSV